jgi:hypothetical protein
MPIVPIEYSGSVAHFRAWMDRYLAVNGKVWTSPKTQQEYEVYYSSEAQTTMREVWIITPIVPVIEGSREEDKHWATILATEFPNKTTVEFIDGLYYHRDTRGYTIGDEGQKIFHWEWGSFEELAKGDLIGDDFTELAQEIIREWGNNVLSNTVLSNNLPQEPQTRNLDDWFAYYHACKKTRIKITLGEIAGKTSHNASYVRQRHMNYVREHEE